MYAFYTICHPTETHGGAGRRKRIVFGGWEVMQHKCSSSTLQCISLEHYIHACPEWVCRPMSRYTSPTPSDCLHIVLPIGLELHLTYHIGMCCSCSPQEKTLPYAVRSVASVHIDALRFEIRASFRGNYVICAPRWHHSTRVD